MLAIIGHKSKVEKRMNNMDNFDYVYWKIKEAQIKSKVMQKINFMFDFQYQTSTCLIFFWKCVTLASKFGILWRRIQEVYELMILRTTLQKRNQKIKVSLSPNFAEVGPLLIYNLFPTAAQML